MTVEFRNVTLRYHYDDFDVLTDVNFTLREGVNTILCDIQSGKGTICKLILGNLAPNSGQVLIDGREAVKLAKKETSALYLSDKPTFFENKSVLYNLQYPCRVRKTLKQNAENLTRLADEFGLTDLLSQKVKTLTYVQKLKLSLARGLSVTRDIVLFDGFFDDTKLADTPQLSMENLLPKFQGVTVVLTNRAELSTGNTVVMDGGKCVFEGDSETAKQTVANLAWLADKI